MKTMTVQELKNQLDHGKVLLVDVREPAEHHSEYIQDSYLIPLGKITVNELPSTRKPIVLYCRLGQRSKDACLKLLASNPFLDVASLEGGIIAWTQAGYPVKKSGVSILPLDRQAQIVSGLLAVFGTLLGTWIHSIFFIIPGFIGAGLVFSGITGWCGMAKLMAKMPWNS